MKISKLTSLKIYLFAGLFFLTQLSYAADPILLPPDGTPKEPPTQTDRIITSEEISASATISDTELTVYFDWSVGDAVITVYDSNNNVVCQETADTDITTEVDIPVDIWSSGNYMITVTYGSITQRGYFSLE